MMMSVQEWTQEMVICVTYGGYNVVKYQFLCRTPFTIGNKTYLSDGETEEHHLAAINGEDLSIYYSFVRRNSNYIIGLILIFMEQVWLGRTIYDVVPKF